METKLKPDTLMKRVEEECDSNIVPVLQEFVKIPNLSQNFDTTFHTNGLIQQVCHLYLDWAKKQNIKGVKKLDLYEEKGRTPLLIMVVEASDPSIDSSVLLYGHLDKQPHMLNDWSEGLDPLCAKIIDEKMYGRGASDDGYAFLGCVGMLKLLQEAGAKHPKMIIFAECDEESGSRDVMHHMEVFKDEIGSPDLVVCLDSGALDYDHFY